MCVWRAGAGAAGQAGDLRVPLPLQQAAHHCQPFLGRRGLQDKVPILYFWKESTSILLIFFISQVRDKFNATFEEKNTKDFFHLYNFTIFDNKFLDPQYWLVCLHVSWSILYHGGS
jgi:hypothetical protein